MFPVHNRAAVQAIFYYLCGTGLKEQSYCYIFAYFFVADGDQTKKTSLPVHLKTGKTRISMAWIKNVLGKNFLSL
jgi:hypothetical protein